MAYRVKLDIFEGPFDLLLFLIRKHEVDIYDIPIHTITKQFLEYLELMQLLDLEVAGDFIEMIAILMSIKAKMLLPKPAFEDEDIEDPRTELVERLLEYKKFKEAAGDMSMMEDHRRLLYPRKYIQKIEKHSPLVSTEEYLENVTLFDMLLAFKKALDNMPKVTHHEVRRIEVTIEEQTAYILAAVSDKSQILFSELCRSLKDKIFIIVTFLALLDLIKLGKIKVTQTKIFEEITISLAA
jgi:segregation and condensation protein A